MPHLIVLPVIVSYSQNQGDISGFDIPGLTVIAYGELCFQAYAAPCAAA